MNLANQHSFAERLEALKHQRFLNSREWNSIRVACIRHHMVDGKISCYACGKPLPPILWDKDDGRVTIHHMRYPNPNRRLVIERDVAPICGKCHYIISNNPHLQDERLSKTELPRLMNEFFARRNKLRKEHPNLRGSYVL